MDTEPNPQPAHRRHGSLSPGAWIGMVMAAVMIYVLSAGPVIGFGRRTIYVTPGEVTVYPDTRFFLTRVYAPVLPLLAMRRKSDTVYYVRRAYERYLEWCGVAILVESSLIER